MGGVESDELYVGIDRHGTHYVLPVEAKGAHEHIGVVQIEEGIALCMEKFPALTCRPIAAQFMAANVVALFEFEMIGDDITKREERHYKLVAPEELTSEELAQYKRVASI